MKFKYQARYNSRQQREVIVLALVASFILVGISVFYNRTENLFAFSQDSDIHHNSTSTSNASFDWKKYTPGNQASTSSSSDPLLIDACGSPVDAKNTKADKRFCSKEHERVVEQCSPPGANTFLMRNYGPRNKTFTVQPLPDTDSNVIMKPLPQCHNVSEYLQSIKFGTRQWEMNTSSDEGGGQDFNRTDPLELEKHVSRFIPSHCFVPNIPPSPEKTCEIFNSYSQFHVDGDSLSRHMKQTMIMIMRGGDWSTGGIMTKNSVTKAQCMCDGQYSENAKCRVFDNYFTSLASPIDIPLSTDEDVKKEEENITKLGGYSGICGNLLKSSLSTMSMEDMDTGSLQEGRVDELQEARNDLFQIGSANKLRRSDVPWHAINCTNPDYRGLFLMVQAGLHFMNDVRVTYSKKVLPILPNPVYQECVKQGKVDLVFIGLTAQSRRLDNAYNHQSREHALIFNQEMKRLIANSSMAGSEDVMYLDWWNMTKDSNSDDGLHSMMDVNLSKASQVLYLMNMLRSRRL